VLVFVQSKERAKELFHELIYDGINVDVITSERTPIQVCGGIKISFYLLPPFYLYITNKYLTIVERQHYKEFPVGQDMGAHSNRCDVSRDGFSCGFHGDQLRFTADNGGLHPQNRANRASGEEGCLTHLLYGGGHSHAKEHCQRHEEFRLRCARMGFRSGQIRVQHLQIDLHLI